MLTANSVWKALIEPDEAVTVHVAETEGEGVRFLAEFGCSAPEALAEAHRHDRDDRDDVDEYRRHSRDVSKHVQHDRLLSV